MHRAAVTVDRVQNSSVNVPGEEYTSHVLFLHDGEKCIEVRTRRITTDEGQWGVGVVGVSRFGAIINIFLKTLK